MIKFSAEYNPEANVASEDGEIIIPPSYDEAQTYDYWPETDLAADSYESLRVEHEGVAISVGMRALAIESLMKSLNTMNGKHAFAYAAYHDPSDKDIHNRYGYKTDDVVTGALRKADQASLDFENGFNVLAGSDEDYLRAGFSLEEIKQTKQQMYEDLINQYGVGNAYAKDRNGVIKRANKTALNVARLVDAIK